ncbi:MAG: zinc ribbon domain-containing protein [Luteolibacter sp.]
MICEPAERRWVMATYVYETIPQGAGEIPVRFEFQQGMNDPKLTEQPGTGKPVRRLVSGGFILLPGKPTSVGSVTDASFHQKD